jgi:predicted ATPase
MQSWQLLQLEPSALREPDSFTTPPGMLADGSHLPATLYYLARAPESVSKRNGDQPEIYDRVALRLSEFIDDITGVAVDRNQLRELLTLQVTERNGTVYPARSLSDGTLRFLALAVLDLNSSASGLICMEEPENGIHPSRIPAIIKLLQDIACDVESPVGPDNPLRQVIINTHSPSVVNQVPDDSLLVAELREISREGVRCKAARFGWLPDTWRQRAEPGVRPIAKGQLLAYLNPVLPAEVEPVAEDRGKRRVQRRVIDRDDIRQLGFVLDAQAVGGSL